MSTCCTVWKEKCSKLEAGRKHLRQAVQILNEQIDKIQAENTTLKNANDEERARADAEKSGKEKELALRISFEDEIAVLRSEISSLQQNGSTNTEDRKGQVKILQDHLCKAEKEITQLKALLEKEKTRADSEKKNAETQKRSASEALKQVKLEKEKAIDEKKLGNIERKKAEEFQFQLEALKKEVDEAKLKLASETLKSEVAVKKLEEEKLNAIKERKRADLEMVKAEKQRKLAEENEKNFIKEKYRAENLLKQLEDAIRELEELKKDKNSLTTSRNFSQLPVDQHDQSGLSALKSEILSLQQTESEKAKDKTWEKEINFLKDLLDNEKKLADSAKKSAVEARKHLKAEKTKADKEKKSADTERKKAEEYKIQFEALRKEANEIQTKLSSEISEFEEVNQKLKNEKSQLSNQLEESRHKIAALQTKVHELLSFASVTETPTVLPAEDVNSETRKLKLVQQKLKLEKMRLKYAKQMAKLEANRSSLLQEELGLIKRDSVKISQRLVALDKWLLSGSQFREDLEKVGLSANMQKSSLKRKLCGIEPFQIYAQNEREFLKPRYGAFTPTDALRQICYCTDEFLPTCEGNRTEAISGIHSKLKSLQGGSYQKLRKSSAINSSSASFSDSQLVGSQVKSAFVSASDKWMEETCGAQTCSGISGELAKVQCNENLAIMAENSVRSPHGVDAFRRVNGHGRKFMGMCDSIESIKYLCSEGKKLHMQMEEKLSVLYDLLNKELGKHLEESKYVEAGVQCDSFAKHERAHKKSKVCRDERTVMKDLTGRDGQEKTVQMGNTISEEASTSRHISPSDIEMLGALQEPVKGLMDSFGGDLEPIDWVVELENGDYMKLLDLDNHADEECYRRATEMPLSPSLPEVEIPSAENCDMDTPPIGDSREKGLPNHMEIIVPSHSFEFIDVDASSNNRRYEALGSENDRASKRHLKDFEVVQLSTTPRSSDAGLVSSNSLSKSKIVTAHAGILTYCVVFSNVKDCGSISRIFTVTRTCLSRCSSDTERDCIVQKILHFLKMEEKLLLKEKACALFTLLLLNFSEYFGENFRSYWDKDFIFHSDSFATQISAVMSNVEVRSFFMDLCCIDGLLGLFEDFLLNGQLVVHTSEECDTGMNIFPDDMMISLSYEAASDNQLLAGSIILSLICTAIDRIELVFDASYILLRSRKFDNNFLLIILHIFANITGEKFFSLKEYNLTMTVLKSIVTHLERGIPSVSSTCLREAKFTFHPCAECPFDAVSMDMVVLLLLEKLHSYAPVTVHNLSKSRDVYCKDNANHNFSEKEVSWGLDVNHDASCALYASVIPTSHPDSVNSGTLCDLSDLLSLVELLACYVSWESTSTNIIPVLLEILETPIHDNFAVALIILLGQLGSLGVAACGYEDKEVENLMRNLSNFLRLDKTIDAPSMSVQIAANVSLLQLVSVDVEGVIRSDLKLQEAARQSVVDHIRKWFSLLSQEQQTLALGVLQYGKKQ